MIRILIKRIFRWRHKRRRKLFGITQYGRRLARLSQYRDKLREETV